MLLIQTLRPLLLAGICLCACGTPVHLPGVQHNQDIDCSGECAGSLKTKNLRSEHSDVKSVTGLLWKAGAGVGAAPHEPPMGESLVTQTENWDGHDGISGSTAAGGGVRNNRSEITTVGIGSQARDSPRQSSSVSPLFPDQLVTPNQADVPPAGFPLDGILAPSSILPQMNVTERASRDPGGTKGKEHEADWTDYHPSSIPPLDFVTPQNSAPDWDQYGPPVPSLPDPLLADIGPNLMPREDGPESVWTEATRASEADTVVQLSPDDATEGTMSSEALPLIFEPLEDAVSEKGPPDAASVITLAPGSPQPPADGDGPSPTPPASDWTSPWQTSGTEQLEPSSFWGPSVSPRRAGGAVKTLKFEVELPTDGPSFSSDQRTVSASAVTTHQHKPRSGLEVMESEEEPDEDEEEENSEESLEDESEEEVTETPESPSSSSSVVCVFPPPPVWVQCNQGLMRSWLELIKEKAGYVSGMLAPVGIGISGALLIVGALYGIRTLHRKRRNNLKHQRKTRQQEQPGEAGSSSQDQAMLLADSSEDEF